MPFTLDDSNLPKLHRSFKVAFDVIDSRFDNSVLRFALFLDELHGTSPDVDRIMQHWLMFWATRDSPGTTWRFTMHDQSARFLLDEAAGGEVVWLEAADAFLEHYRSA